ncbi:sensitivity to red-light reduced protein [Apophysomyces ossiformis]|uniref:Sensitivity to red-light reduced protein n=1 Tax=Apophysomyces ossiformis TaxID=679940 RepID=A0A8H7BMH6_9FUNG|nr:sensitivity to red-light reduced protein [Apophysomyces ossiformis]
MTLSEKASSASPALLRLLLVDDNHINLRILSRLLTKHFADQIQHMELVQDGLEALKLLHHQPFDLVLMDIDMPILNGVETTRRIRAMEHENSNVPIVAVTTNDTLDQKQLYADIGMCACISKPIIPDELKKILDQVFPRFA